MSKLNIEVQSLIDAQDNAFVLINAHYEIVAANKIYCTSYGVSTEEIVGRRCHEVSHHSAVPCHENGEHCPHQQVFATGQPCHTLHVHYDQFERPERVRLQGYPIAGRDGQLYLGETIFPLHNREELDCDDMRMIGRSPAFLACVDHLTSAAESEAPVLLYGESGVGKELAAQYVHRRSSRKSKTFIAVDCASIAETLFESELFGHERGAFTGCIGRKQGLFELADGGTLFLDEIGEIPLTMQAKLLRVLESGEFRRVGGREVLQADVRVVSATNRNLLQMAEAGSFRRDLYYRLSGIDVALPPLRERRMDIPPLAEMILARIQSPASPRYRLNPDAVTRLAAYHYPGNIRELRNILLKAAALSSTGLITQAHILLNGNAALPAALGGAANPALATEGAPSIMEMEVQYIAELLHLHDGHRRKVADILGVSERTLYRKLKRYQLITQI